MIRFHPHTQQLESFVEGSLSPAVSILVSAHCDMCSHCQRIVEIETERLASSLFEDNRVSEPLFSPDFDNMLAHITQMPSAVHPDHPAQSRHHKPRSHNKERSASTIELDGRAFTLPRTLRRYADKTGNWSSLVGKLWQAPVELGNQGVANFIYMGPGGSVPEHTHRGTEYTLVLDGEFSDGLNNYDTGDFIFMDDQHTHTPRADKKEGCLVFSIVDQPLHFTSGLARLLNPFSHLFFR
ncbi:anti-sigma factor [Alteromonas sp. 345S023]|uniref:Anti-sigma factor n=1 Tax=Alteromonas profundi TaxID=2696062 RepID=A0A7X5RLV3_9ALTE|nr:ChrR family anti-sigma-E factor [Alteromonas profundi]NDV92129.1 anti-sigma factor [Alteromonas profundi]